VAVAARSSTLASVEPDFDVIIPIVVIVAVVLVGVFISSPSFAPSRARPRRPRLLRAAGLPARGLVLTCNRVSSGVTVNGVASSSEA